MNATAAAFLAIPEGILLGLICAGAGRRLCGILLPDSTPLERSVLGFPIGMGLLSLFTTGLLFSGAPHGVLLAGVLLFLAAGAVWGGKEALGLLRDLQAFARAFPLLAALIVASALLGLIGCMAPETGWDTGVYHFAMARLRAEQGGMIVRLDVPHSYRPAYMESLYTAGFLLNGEALASMVNLMFYFAGLSLARLWGIRLAGARGGLFAALAWMTSITYVLRMDGGDVEVGQAVFLGTALLALLRLRDGGSGNWRILAGGALGVLLGSKYASVYMILPLAVVWAVVRLGDRESWRGWMLDGVVLAGLGLLIASPFYIRNKMQTGSFFFPMLSSPELLGTGDAAPAPIGLVPAAQIVALDGFILAGVGALFLKRASRDRWAGIASLLVAGLILMRMGLIPRDFSNGWRYASPAWLPLLVVGGAGVAVLAERGGALRFVAPGILIGALAFGQGVLATRNLPKLPAAMGLADRDSYLGGRVSTYSAIREAERGLKPGRKILLVEERCYYCRAPFLAAGDHQYGVNLDSLRTAAEVRRFLTEHSIGAIVVDRSPDAKIWRFRNLERRLGVDWPPAGVQTVPMNNESSLYRVE